MGRFQLELIYLYFPSSFHQTGQNQQLFDGKTVENKGKLILTCFQLRTPIAGVNAPHRTADS